MVSFQCDGCQDVVKKPKLDNHNSRCHASFTCIDCSKTFAGPGQWKSHTSCMSEEQKYHKSVYQERGRGRGRGQRGRGGARGGFTRSQYSGSGENSIPLGTQANGWTAPSPDPVNNAPFDSTEWTSTTEATAEPATAPQASAPEPESGSKESKKSKKRKAEDAQATDPAAATSTADEPTKKKKKKDSLAPESIVEPPADNKEKKKKSRKSEATDQNGDVTVVNVEDITTNGREKKSKKSRKSEGEAPAVFANGDSALPNSIPPPDESLPVLTDEPSKKKKKSRKSEGAPDTPTAGTEPTTNGNGVDKKHKKDKKSKGDNSNGVSVPSIAPVPTSTPGALPETNDLIPVSVIESSDSLSKKEKQKKAKKEKKEQAKAEAKAKPVLPALDVPAPQDDALPTSAQPALEAVNGEVTTKPGKSRKKEKKEKRLKAVEGAAEVDESPRKRKSESKPEADGASEDVPKKKKSKREKETKDAVSVV